MYEELVERLRTCGNSLSCNKCKWSPDCDGPSEVLRKAAETIEEMSKPKWIPVTERLPKKGELVLGYTPCDGYMFVGKCYTHKFGNETDVDWQIITAMRSTRTMRKKVTHWMPLPAAPEPQKG